MYNRCLTHIETNTLLQHFVIFRIECVFILFHIYAYSTTKQESAHGGSYYFSALLYAEKHLFAQYCTVSLGRNPQQNSWQARAILFLHLFLK